MLTHTHTHTHAHTHTHTHTHTSLQKFKLNIANTVISQENSSLLSMNTSELLDLFQLSEASEGGRLELVCMCFGGGSLLVSMVQGVWISLLSVYV